MVLDARKHCRNENTQSLRLWVLNLLNDKQPSSKECGQMTALYNTAQSTCESATVKRLATNED